MSDHSCRHEPQAWLRQHCCRNAADQVHAQFRLSAACRAGTWNSASVSPPIFPLAGLRDSARDRCPIMFPGLWLWLNSSRMNPAVAFVRWRTPQSPSGQMTERAASTGDAVRKVGKRFSQARPAFRERTAVRKRLVAVRRGLTAWFAVLRLYGDWPFGRGPEEGAPMDASTGRGATRAGIPGGPDTVRA
jgi:hypothetical protein